MTAASTSEPARGALSAAETASSGDVGGTMSDDGDRSRPGSTDGDWLRPVPTDGDRSRDSAGDVLRHLATGRCSSDGAGPDDDDVIGGGHVTLRYDVSWFSSPLSDDSLLRMRRSASSWYRS